MISLPFLYLKDFMVAVIRINIFSYNVLYNNWVHSSKTLFVVLWFFLLNLHIHSQRLITPIIDLVCGKKIICKTFSDNLDFSWEIWKYYSYFTLELCNVGWDAHFYIFISLGAFFFYKIWNNVMQKTNGIIYNKKKPQKKN